MVKLIELLGNGSLLKVILFFTRKPATKACQKDVSKEVKISKVTALKCLSRLEKQGILIASNLKS